MAAPVLCVDMSSLSALILTKPSPLRLNTALISLHLNGVLSLPGCVDGGALSISLEYLSFFESDARNTKTQCTVEKYLDLELEFDLFRPILILL